MLIAFKAFVMFSYLSVVLQLPQLFSMFKWCFWKATFCMAPIIESNKSWVEKLDNNDKYLRLLYKVPQLVFQLWILVLPYRPSCSFGSHLELPASAARLPFGAFHSCRTNQNLCINSNIFQQSQADHLLDSKKSARCPEEPVRVRLRPQKLLV